MTRPDRRTAIACALVALTPAAGVVAARFVGAGPRTAAASVPFTLPPLIELPPPASEEPAPDLAALPSPFRVGELTLAPMQPPEIGLPPPAAPEPGAPTFTLTTVMPHPSRPLAVINGRPRSVGDEIVQGWRLTAIDGDARQVVISGPDGRPVRVRMSTTPSP